MTDRPADRPTLVCDALAPRPRRACGGSRSGPPAGRRWPCSAYFWWWRCSVCCRSSPASPMPRFCWRSAPAFCWRSRRRSAVSRCPTARPPVAASSGQAGSRIARCKRLPTGRAPRSTRRRRSCGTRTDGAWRRRRAGCGSAGPPPDSPPATLAACARRWRCCWCSARSTPAAIGATGFCARSRRASPAEPPRSPPASTSG